MSFAHRFCRLRANKWASAIFTEVVQGHYRTEAVPVATWGICEKIGAENP